jgi:hypothetical protein
MIQEALDKGVLAFGIFIDLNHKLLLEKLSSYYYLLINCGVRGSMNHGLGLI